MRCRRFLLEKREQVGAKFGVFALEQRGQRLPEVVAAAPPPQVVFPGLVLPGLPEPPLSLEHSFVVDEDKGLFKDAQKRVEERQLPFTRLAV